MNAVPARHRYHSLSVQRVVPETADAISIVFDVSAELAGTFAYRSGQFVTIKVRIDGEEHVRSYSMSSAPRIDPALQVTVKRVPEGLVSNWLIDNVAEGSIIDVQPPGGSFVLGDADADVVAFAAGSGITPVYSILKSGLASGTRRFRLLYANRDRESAIFAAELEALAARHPDRLTLAHHLDVDQGFVRCTDVVEFIADSEDAEFFICGPAPFMDTIETALRAERVPGDRIHVERFTPEQTEATGDVDEIEVVITLGRDTKSVQHRAGTTILQSARSAGLRAPSSCETGTCATCMARIVEGAADMRNNEALTADEVADGWVLTCQAVPAAPVVKVVYE